MHTARRLADTPARIIVVDDHEPWRRQVCSLLLKGREWTVVGEGSDGLEAVQQADELKPDLILLDVELPTVNGIEAARRILSMNPQARVLFVSAHSSRDIADAALSAGARGYVLKADAGHELLPAMEAVLADRPYISSVLGSVERHDANPGVNGSPTRRFRLD